MVSKSLYNKPIESKTITDPATLAHMQGGGQVIAQLPHKIHTLQQSL